MSKQTINLGSAPNDRTGDKLRVAFDKINDNFTELFAADASQTQSELVNGSHTLALGEDGNVTIPEGKRIICRSVQGNPTGDSYVEAGEGFRLHSGEGVSLEAANLDTETTHYWHFGLDGSTGFPYLPAPTILENQYCKTIKFPFAEANALITTQSGEQGYENPDDLFICGGDGYSYGQGADTKLFSGNGGTRRQTFGPAFTQSVLVTGDYTVTLPLTDYNAHSNQYTPYSTVLQIDGSYTITDIQPDGDNFVALTLNSPIGQSFQGTITVTIDDIAPDAYSGNGGTAELTAGNGITGGGVYISGGSSVSSDEIPWCGGTVQITGGNSSHGTGGHVVLSAGQNSQGTFGRNGNIKMSTIRGTVIFGGEPEAGPTAPNHWHITKDGTLDLFFGDDYNNFRLPWDGGASISVANPNNEDQFTWAFRPDGKSNVPGTVISYPVYPTPGTQQIGRVTAISVTNSPHQGWSNGTGVVINGLNFVVSISQDGQGTATVETINDGGVGHWVGETFGPIQGDAFGGASPADDMYFVVDAIDAEVFTDLDLAKLIHVLNSDGMYRLPDGEEGQIIYLVLAANSNPNEWPLMVVNGRVGSNTYTNIWFAPFYNGDTGVVTMIFTQGAWSASSGAWD